MAIFFHQPFFSFISLFVFFNKKSPKCPFSEREATNACLTCHDAVQKIFGSNMCQLQSTTISDNHTQKTLNIMTTMLALCPDSHKKTERQ